jgi:hypothetical protein
MKTSLFFHSKHKSGGESEKKKKKKKKKHNNNNNDVTATVAKSRLNVYDLHDSNQYLYALGMGVFHSGVEINGTEWSFGACATARASSTQRLVCHWAHRRFANRSKSAQPHCRAAKSTTSLANSPPPTKARLTI